MVSSCSLRAKPVAEVGGDGVEVAAQAVAGEGGDAVVVQTQLKIMEQGIGILLLAAAQMQRGDDLGDGVNGQPEPLDASPDLGVQFVELDEGQDEDRGSSGCAVDSLWVPMRVSQRVMVESAWPV